MKDVDLTEEQLEKVVAGVSNMSKEELNEAKRIIGELPGDVDESEIDV